MEIRLHSIDEAREKLGGISRATIYRLLNTKQLAGKKVNKRTMITEKAIRDYIDTLEDYNGAPNEF